MSFLCIPKIIPMYFSVKNKQKMSSEELQVCIGFSKEIDSNGSCTWEASFRKMSICCYFNNENINVLK